MTKLERVLHDLGELYEFNKAIRPFRITPEIIEKSEELKRSRTAAVMKQVDAMVQSNPLPGQPLEPSLVGKV